MGQVRRLARRVVALERGRLRADMAAPAFFAAVTSAPAAGFSLPEVSPCSL
jgi:hypothetical protein